MKLSSSVWLLCAVTILISAGCSPSTDTTKPIKASASDAPTFSYDNTLVSGVKPWSSESFNNNPRSFQFAIIGDRTGGANVEGTFMLAMEQLNLLQREFVINVGDLIEAYSDDKAELREMWDEADSIEFIAGQADPKRLSPRSDDGVHSALPRHGVAKQSRARPGGSVNQIERVE